MTELFVTAVGCAHYTTYRYLWVRNSSLRDPQRSNRLFTVPEKKVEGMFVSAVEFLIRTVLFDDKNRNSQRDDVVKLVGCKLAVMFDHAGHFDAIKLTIASIGLQMEQYKRNIGADIVEGIYVEPMMH